MNRRAFLRLLPLSAAGTALALSKGCEPPDTNYGSDSVDVRLPWKRTEEQPLAQQVTDGLDRLFIEGDPLLPPYHANCRCAVYPEVLDESAFLYRFDFTNPLDRVAHCMTQEYSEWPLT